MKKIEKKNLEIRIIIVGLFFIVFYGIIATKALYLQILESPYLSQKAAGEYESSLEYHGRRGVIYDIKLREMAVSNDVTSVAAYPVHVENPKHAAKCLSSILKINETSLERRLSSKRSFVWVKRKVTPGEEYAVKKLDLRGIGFVPEHSRFYPNRMLAAQILGFTGIDGRGLEGIEFYYDTYLKGMAGKFTVLKDALGRGFAKRPQISDSVFNESGVFAFEKKAVSNHGGNNLILTIDRTIQYITEKAVKEAVRQFSAKSGMAIVMVPETGAILSLAHYPFFNPNTFGNFDREKWRNRAITDPFEPGSTMKIFSVATALDSGLCKPDTILFCENGKYKIGDDVIHDSHAHGWLTLQKIIKYSSNIGAVKISEVVGPERLYNTLRKFGFGEKTGIDCPGETSGSLPPPRRWSKVRAGTIAYGYGISISAIQLITAVSAIANDGVLMKPYIVQAITDQNGNPVEITTPDKGRQVISAKNARIVKKMMKSVAEEGGTGVKAAIKGYSVCGKTGTAKKIDNSGSYAAGKYIASFAGFVPENRTEVAILVVIDEPDGAYYGSEVAAPTFRKIAHEILNYLNIPPHIDMNRLTASWESENEG